jgi:hypothetical protein
LIPHGLTDVMDDFNPVIEVESEGSQPIVVEESQEFAEQPTVVEDSQEAASRQ